MEPFVIPPHNQAPVLFLNFFYQPPLFCFVGVCCGLWWGVVFFPHSRLQKPIKNTDFVQGLLHQKTKGETYTSTSTGHRHLASLKNQVPLNPRPHAFLAQPNPTPSTTTARRTLPRASAESTHPSAQEVPPVRCHLASHTGRRPGPRRRAACCPGPTNPACRCQRRSFLVPRQRALPLPQKTAD